jgi:EAL domain-containing protein (putative c-di-GMP-specific phosphodiesterase class I)
MRLHEPPEGGERRDPLTRGAPEEQEYFRLRAEWLRLKNHLFDTNTELPTLAAVQDDVRRRMEERGTLGLFYLDLGGGGLEMLHGWHAYDDILKAFASSLGQLREEGFLDPRDIVAILSVRSDKFLLILGRPGGLPFDKGSLDEHATRLHSRVSELLERHSLLGRMPITFHDGHALVSPDSMLRAERSAHRALDEAMYMSLRHRTTDEDRRALGLDAIIQGKLVTTLFQPIMDLRTMAVLGHEVFARGPSGGPFEDAESLFALAERTGRLAQLERLCRNQALCSAPKHLGKGSKLFLNTSAVALQDPEVAGEGFIRQVEAQGLMHGDVVLEITERVAGAGRQAYHQVLRTLKRQGFGIAIDDMGAGYSSLQSVVELEPDYTKFDISLVRNIDRSLIKRSLLETLVELSEKIGADVIAEGIEVESEFTTLRELGVRLGQGRYLAPPRAVPGGETP